MLLMTELKADRKRSMEEEREGLARGLNRERGEKPDHPWSAEAYGV